MSLSFSSHADACALIQAADDRKRPFFFEITIMAQPFQSSDFLVRPFLAKA